MLTAYEIERINEVLKLEGLRKASYSEAGWIYTVIVDGVIYRSLWVTDLS